MANSKCCMFIFLFKFTDKYWDNVHNRRKFFSEFASQKGFDPLVAVNWENVQYREMVKVRRKKKCDEGKREQRVWK